MSANSVENLPKSLPNSNYKDDFLLDDPGMNEQCSRRGPYGAVGLMESAMDNVQMAKKYLKDIVEHPTKSSEEVIRAVSLAAMCIAEVGEDVRVAKGKYDDYFRKYEVDR